jgi:hypothetical protein
VRLMMQEVRKSLAMRFRQVWRMERWIPLLCCRRERSPMRRSHLHPSLPYYTHDPERRASRQA